MMKYNTNYTPFPVNIRGRCKEINRNGSLRTVIQIFTKENPAFSMKEEKQEVIKIEYLGEIKRLEEELEKRISSDFKWLYTLEQIDIDISGFTVEDPHWFSSDHSDNFKKKYFFTLGNLEKYLKDTYDLSLIDLQLFNTIEYL